MYLVREAPDRIPGLSTSFGHRLREVTFIVVSWSTHLQTGDSLGCQLVQPCRDPALITTTQHGGHVVWRKGPRSTGRDCHELLKNGLWDALDITAYRKAHR